MSIFDFLGGLFLRTFGKVSCEHNAVKWKIIFLVWLHNFFWKKLFYKKNLENQLDLMKTNSDYTQEDCDEVQTLINQISLQMTYYS